MAAYKLRVSKYADQDLNNLYLEGFEEWGVEQADRYYNALLRHFDLLCESPLQYMAVDDIRAGYRRSVCGKHSIYYRIDGNEVIIMGIIKRQNPMRHLP